VAIATRSEPPLPLARLRARGELVEFRLDELAFDRVETEELLRTYGVATDAPLLDALLGATEGWATGLYLALLAGRGRSPGEWLPHVHGNQREIAAYLLDEVLDRQSPDLQSFLLQTSILDELAAPLCAAVTGRADAGAVLARLARDNLFVTALDDRDERYRYHHLFAELLRSRLERDRPSSLRPLHRAAAEWYRVNDWPSRAVEQWLAAGDAYGTDDLVPYVCDQYLQLGHLDSARRLLELFTERQLLSEPSLTLAAGWVFAAAVGTPDEQLKWTSLACTMAVDDRPSPDGAASLRASQAMPRALLAPDGIARMGEDAQIATQAQTIPGDGWYEIARVSLGAAWYLAGSPARARKPLLDILERCVDSDTRCWTLSYLSLMAGDRGNWDEAGALLSPADELVPEVDLDAERCLSMYVPLLLARARIMSRRDDPATLPFVERVGTFVDRMVHQARWCVLMARVILGEVALEQGDLALARRQSAQASATLAGYPDVGMLSRRTVRLAVALDQRGLAEPVTRAEKRVLELLPTRRREPSLRHGRSQRRHPARLERRRGRVVGRLAAGGHAHSLRGVSHHVDRAHDGLPHLQAPHRRLCPALLEPALPMGPVHGSQGVGA
jgi:LuxR family maltose regulon positive regulatory protein